MSVDKLVDSTQLDADITSVANAIRTKGGTSEALTFPSGMVTAIGNITTGTDTSDGTATASDIVAPKVAYSKGNRLVGNIQPRKIYETYIEEGNTMCAINITRLLNSDKVLSVDGYFICNGVAYNQMRTARSNVGASYAEYRRASDGSIFEVSNILGYVIDSYKTIFTRSSEVYDFLICPQSEGIVATITSTTATGRAITVPSGYYSNTHDIILECGGKALSSGYAFDVRGYAYAYVNDANLVAENVRSGITILGTTGTYAPVSVPKNVQVDNSVGSINALVTGEQRLLDITASKTGTYTVYWSGMKSTTSTSVTCYTVLYVGGVQVGSRQSTWSGGAQAIKMTGVPLSEGDIVAVWGKASATGAVVYASNLIIIEE